ncbi:MAG TPA: hypothetical protein VFE62_12220 [Gemmataceae bacterium]|nr:hypothetical protein [Gemmataceae bacterium]
MAREDVRNLFRFIDWVMDLPEILALEFNQTLHLYEEEKRMPYVTSIERHAIEKGRQEGRLEGKLERELATCEMLLTHKFGNAGLALLPLVQKLASPERLKEIQKAILDANTVEDVAQLLE